MNSIKILAIKNKMISVLVFYFTFNFNEVSLEIHIETIEMINKCTKYIDISSDTMKLDLTHESNQLKCLLMFLSSDLLAICFCLLPTDELV